MSDPIVNQRIEELEALLPLYTEHLNELRSLLTQLDSFIAVFQHTDDPEREQNVRDFRKQLEFAGFLMVCAMDLLVTSKNLMKVKEIWEEVYYLRHGYLTIYEGINTYHKFGEWLHKTMRDKHTSLQPDLVEMNQRLKEFKKRYSYDMYMPALRNTVTAHIDHNFVSYFNEISKFDQEKGTGALLDFIAILSKMQQLLKKIGMENNILIGIKNTALEVTVQDSIRHFNRELDQLQGKLADNQWALHFD